MRRGRIGLASGLLLATACGFYLGAGSGLAQQAGGAEADPGADSAVPPEEAAGWTPDDPRIGKTLMVTEGITDANGLPVRQEWTFEHLMQEMAGAIDPAHFVADWLLSFEEQPRINGLFPLVRPGPNPNDDVSGIREVVINPWKTALGIGLSHATDRAWADHPDFFATAPFRLSAIVNRIDLLKLATDLDGNFTDELRSPGEGRFVFQVTDQAGKPLPFTVILEYRIPVANRAELGAWAQEWLALGDLELGTDAYNDALADLTERFAARAPSRVAPNNNIINQVRTNEIALDIPPQEGGTWELREFRLSAEGDLRPSTVNMNPAFRYSGVTVAGTPDPRFAEEEKILINFIQSCVRGELDPEAVGGVTGSPFVIPHVLQPADEVPGVDEVVPFLGASAPTPTEFVILPPPPDEEVGHEATWLADATSSGGTANPCPLGEMVAGAGDGWEAHRRWFAFNTCSGCHAGEAGTFFTHVELNRPTGGDILSSFLREQDLPVRGMILEGHAQLFGRDDADAASSADMAAADEPRASAARTAAAEESAEPSLAEMLNRAQEDIGTALAADADVPAAAAPATAERAADEPRLSEEDAAFIRALLQRQTRVH